MSTAITCRTIETMANFPTIRIRTRRKYYRLIFTGLMAMMM
ncbi:hypothetical protein ACQKDP_10695 [Psychrobacter pacificensis]